MLFKKLDQISRSARFKPVVSVLFFLESIEQTERVVYSRTVRIEMVAVIVLFELLAGLPEGLSVDRGKLLYVFAEVVNKFFFTYPADVIICLVSGNVLQCSSR